MEAEAAAPKGAKLYRAFVSYSHKDKAFGRWLHNRLETYRFPKDKVGAVTGRGIVPARLGRLFRDEWELGAADSLASTIEHALSNAQDLIVICTPAAAQSKWVDKEIRYFKAHRPDGQVFAVIVDGSPGSNDPQTECFPPALMSAVGPDMELIAGQREDPLAANVATDGREDAVIRLLAGLSGLTYNDLRDREAQRVRAQRRRAALTMAAALVLIALAGVGLTLAGMQTWANAIQRTDLLTAEAGRALDADDPERALLLLLAASPAQEGHFGPGFAESPLTEALLARAAFAARLERDMQLPSPHPGLVQYRDGRAYVLQGGEGEEFQGDAFTWTPLDGGEPQPWRLPDGMYLSGTGALGRYGGPLFIAQDERAFAIDPRTGRAGAALTLSQGYASDSAISENGQVAAAFTDQGRLVFYRVGEDLSLTEFYAATVLPRDSIPVGVRLSLSYDGAYALLTWLGGFECHEAGAGGAQVNEQAEFYSGAFKPGTNQFAVATSSGLVQLRNCSGALIGQFVPHDQESVAGVQYSPDGETLLTFQMSGAARLWNSAEVEVMSQLDLVGRVAPLGVLTGLGPLQNAEAFAFSPDGAHVTGADAAGRVRVWDARSGESAGALTTLNTGDLFVGPDGAAYASEHNTGVWRFNAGEEPRNIAPFPPCETGRTGCMLRRVVPLADGSGMIFPRTDGWTGYFDSAAGELRTLIGAPTGVRAAQRMPDGRLALFAQPGRDTQERTLSFWDARTGAQIPGGRTFDFPAAALSPDGRLAAGAPALAGSDSFLVVADAASGAHLSRTPMDFNVFALYSRPLAFTEDGRALHGSQFGSYYYFTVSPSGDSVAPADEPPRAAGEPPWRIGEGVVADRVTGGAITPRFDGDIALNPDATVLYHLEDGRRLRTYALPPRGRALIAYACARLSPDRRSFTDAELNGDSLLRVSDRTPCDRPGLLSPRWWANLF